MGMRGERETDTAQIQRENRCGRGVFVYMCIHVMEKALCPVD